MLKFTNNWYKICYLLIVFSKYFLLHFFCFFFLGGNNIGFGGSVGPELDGSSNTISGSYSKDNSGKPGSIINGAVPSGSFSPGSNLSPGGGKFGGSVYTPVTGGYPTTSTNTISGGKISCCKGPFPGPKGSIYDSKPAPPGGGGPDPAWLTGPGVTGSPSGSGIPKPGVSVSPNLIHKLPGSPGTIYDSKPSSNVGPLVSGGSTGGSSGYGSASGTTSGGVTTIIGTLPGPSGSIYSSKPVSSVGASGTLGYSSTSQPPVSVPGIIGVLPGSSGSIYDSKPAISVTPLPGVSGTLAHGVSGAPLEPVGIPSVIGVLPGSSGSIHSSKPISSAQPHDGIGTTPSGGTYTVGGSYDHTQSGASSSQTTSGISGTFIGTLPGSSGSIYDSKPAGAAPGIPGHPSGVPTTPVFGPVCSYTPGGKQKPQCTAGSPVGTAPLPVSPARPGISGHLPTGSSATYSPGIPVYVGSSGSPSIGVVPGGPGIPVSIDTGHLPAGASTPGNAGIPVYVGPSGSPSIGVIPGGNGIPVSVGTGHLPVGAPTPSSSGVPVYVGPSGSSGGGSLSGPFPAFGTGCKYVPGTKTKLCSGLPAVGTTTPAFGQGAHSTAGADANANADADAGMYKVYIQILFL